jgi:hypothetical protein
MLQMVQTLQVSPRLGLFQTPIPIARLDLLNTEQAIAATDVKDDLGLDLAEFAFQNTAQTLHQQVLL